MTRVTSKSLAAFITALRTRVADFHRICMVKKTQLPGHFARIHETHGHDQDMEEVVEAITSHCRAISPSAGYEWDEFAARLLLDDNYFRSSGYGTNEIQIAEILWTYIAALDHFFFWGALTKPTRYTGSSRGQCYRTQWRPFNLVVSIGPNRQNEGAAYWDNDTGTVYMFTEEPTHRDGNRIKSAHRSTNSFEDMIQYLFHEIGHVVTNIFPYFPNEHVLWKQREFDEGHGMEFLELIIFQFEIIQQAVDRFGLGQNSFKSELDRHGDRRFEILTEGIPPFSADAVSFFRRRVMNSCY
ncbi:hypothetical protein BKA67DRAFT_673829 [Truncatella angustata]|uniref:Uncharacterized protein n=1 Tax=Truncatella angustata TaxID=152316 RepID=A0A9P9A2J6_9PEZI|nr:uncharacterized protein BKA67DRAFT_673829 [Truncatella angustata]KAH6658025.1 hypothetical protein BKA67DRAFT_673829 [Truncatella angustata]